MHDKIVELMLSRFHIDNQDGVIVERKDCEQVADEIISAFADGGYVPQTQQGVELNGKVLFTVGHSVMTGQEWYDRYRTEWNKLIATGDITTRTHIEAAKRAAGIEEITE